MRAEGGADVDGSADWLLAELDALDEQFRGSTNGDSDAPAAV
jgi:hypothetical protein